MNKISIGIGVAVVVLLGLFWSAAEGLPDAPVAVSSAADVGFNELAFTDLRGKETSLTEFSGKPHVVNTWATWCPFCKEELPDFVALQKKYGDAIEVIAINRSEPVAKVQAYLDERGLGDVLTFWMDSGDVFYKAIGGFSMPETLFINSDGQVVVHHRGFMTLEQMQANVEQLF